MDTVPTILAHVQAGADRAELVEWDWPTMLDFARVEQGLMVEMALPPYAAEASACLPDLDPQRRCLMGTLFVRWPGITVAGRSEGGRIRVVRCLFGEARARALMQLCPDPDPAFLKSLLSIRNEALRTLMQLLRRELANPVDRSEAAVAALVDLIAVELQRLIARPQGSGTGRLAGWQFRRIRERLAGPGPTPGVAELAALCGISARHLHRQFLALTGATVADYIEAARIEQAKHLLAARDEPIRAIALACGFAHANSFARAFRRSTGLSPLAFRHTTSPHHALAQRTA
jgi:AraC family transcriptional regulator